MIEIGEMEQVSAVVTENDTAHSLVKDFNGTFADETYADVLATTKMIGLMELAAARILVKVQTPGRLSVGVGVDITHLNTTPANKYRKRASRGDQLNRREIRAVPSGVASQQAKAGDGGVGSDVEIGKR